jgi:hypothetical protein
VRRPDIPLPCGFLTCAALGLQLVCCVPPWQHRYSEFGHIQVYNTRATLPCFVLPSFPPFLQACDQSAVWSWS